MPRRPGARCDVGTTRPEREDAGRIHPRGEEDPCPIFGTPYAKRGLVRIGRKASKSTVRHQERYTREGPDTPKDTPAQSFALRPRRYRGQAPRTYGTAQLKLFGLEEALGAGGWLKALRLDEYAVRLRRPGALQQALFPYLDAL